MNGPEERLDDDITRSVVCNYSMRTHSVASPLVKLCLLTLLTPDKDLTSCARHQEVVIRV